MKILLLDIETAPNKVYTWGLWKQDISTDAIEEPGHTLCWAAKWYKDDKVIFNSILDGKELMLHNIWQLLTEADAVIHYNGTKFDIPTLNQEFIAHGFAPPAPFKQIDLLRTARGRFRLQSNKLDFVAKHLGLKGKVKHKGLDLWLGCMEGDKDSWKLMKQYNKRDVEILGEVYVKLLPWIANHPNWGLFDERDTHICPNCGSVHVQKRGRYHAKTYWYQKYECQKCKKWSRGRRNITPVEKSRKILVGVE